jgi:hypothetical protein
LSGHLDATNEPYPANCTYYCLSIPGGTSTLVVDLTGMEADLDLFVGYGGVEAVTGRVPEQGVSYDWMSNEFGTVDENVTVSGPPTELPYYIEVCSYESLESDFQLEATIGGTGAVTGGGTGTVAGQVCYPSEGIPPMIAYFENVGTGVMTTLDIAADQTQYVIDLDPGTYVAYAWLPDGSIGGSYSQAIPCGLGVSCTDHSLLSITVNAGQTTSGIDLCDWYGAPGDVPPP